MTDTPEPTPSRRLPKAQRREQLLDVALDLVREEGTDALTLARVAERAGVSKPIAYEHFETRAGLLVALYRLYDERQLVQLQQALVRTPKAAADVARVVARAWLTCVAEMGREWQAVSAALKGAPEMGGVQQDLIEASVRQFCEAFAPFTRRTRADLRVRCVALLGAAEALGQDVVRGTTPMARAVDALSEMIVDVLVQ